MEDNERLLRALAASSACRFGTMAPYAEVKAIASGNPAVLTLAEADAELQRLTILKKNHADEQYLARRNLRELPIAIDRLNERICHLSANMATAAAHAANPIIIGNRPTSHENIMHFLGASLDALPEHFTSLRRFELGVYRGLRFGIILHPMFVPEIYLEGSITRQSMLNKDHPGPRAILNAVERLASTYGSHCDTARQDLAIAQAQLAIINRGWECPSLTNPTSRN